MGLNKKLLDSELRGVLTHALEENLDALVDGPARSTVFFCFWSWSQDQTQVRGKTGEEQETGEEVMILL